MYKFNEVSRGRELRKLCISLLTMCTPALALAMTATPVMEMFFNGMERHEIQ